MRCMLCTSGDLVELRLKPTNPSDDTTARFGVAGAIDSVSDALKVRNQYLDLLLLSTEVAGQVMRVLTTEASNLASRYVGLAALP